jgi:hypothetical protein
LVGFQPFQRGSLVSYQLSIVLTQEEVGNSDGFRWMCKFFDVADVGAVAKAMVDGLMV